MSADKATSFGDHASQLDTDLLRQMEDIRIQLDKRQEKVEKYKRRYADIKRKYDAAVSHMQQVVKVTGHCHICRALFAEEEVVDFATELCFSHVCRSVRCLVPEIFQRGNSHVVVPFAGQQSWRP